FTLHVSDPLRDIVKLMVPTLFGSAIYLVNMSVSRVIGLSLNDSAVVLLNLATRLMELPIGVFAIAVSTVIFPLISKYAGEGKWDALAATYHKGLRLILVINVPAAAGLVALALPIVRLLFVRGEFTEGDAVMMQPVLIVSGLGLPFFAYVNIMLRAYYAQRDTKTPVVAAFISFVVNIALSFALMRPFGTMGLALASTLAVVMQAVYLQRQLTRKREALSFTPVLGNLVKITVSAVVMGVVVALAWRAWSATLPATKLYDGLGLVALIGGGTVLYGALVWMLKIEGRDDLALVLARVRGRFSKSK
ncbi:MAG TPA: lipid II flippase MurJ, partial [Opitutaceae bacterium]